ncbi:CBS domain-containing protein [Bacillus swezeyi]|uniref:CBS domain-containing protein n=1 Tax=Bacillus swezeyi TaxID=1925020 RepID=A0A1R1QUU3_9BACI|nr:CBS domain-containing protein [Bacillus swezeyi]MEC1260738.1 CBS domain-containing protein [Bacillus swezeyi]MED1741689.1 CBS domain-containing protein [Bacillus swezeyi]MED2928675.1 CBS domain-containing protein [Bacillus swezeyi]MED2943173.1 CBS domain-containing protein [Bacillus swezeyi]MED2964197.1 CBS domain-containing protein [Bacillus swezeyi]
MTSVKDIMTKDILYCTVLDNVYEAAVKMKDGDVGAIPVVLDDHRELVGIVTDRDLVLRGIAAKKPNSQKVTNVMTTELVTLNEDDSIEKAIDLMGDFQIRRIPVMNGKTLTGIITLGDVSTYEKSNEQAGDALTFISENEERSGDFLH